MLMIYRNYNSPINELLESTAFESSADNLIQFLSTVHASGGGGTGREAIEVCFQSINRLENVSQVILIGDAGYNLDNEITHNRKTKKIRDMDGKQPTPNKCR